MLYLGYLDANGDTGFFFALLKNYHTNLNYRGYVNHILMFWRNYMTCLQI